LELSLFVGRLLIRHNVLLGDNLVAATILENLAKFVNYHTFTASHRFFKFLRAPQKTDCLEANSLDLTSLANSLSWRVVFPFLSPDLSFLRIGPRWANATLHRPGSQAAVHSAVYRGIGRRNKLPQTKACTYCRCPVFVSRVFLVLT